jgi:translation initiation factor IF-2
MQALEKIKDEEVAVKVIHSGVGNVTEGDVIMASASSGIVIGFHVDVPAQAEKTAEREGVDILRYKIIYKLIEDITKLLAGLIEPEIVEVEIGKAEVKQIFFSGKKEMIIGCKVTNGKVKKGAKARLIREDETVEEVEIDQLKRVKENVEEIKADSECGIKLKGKHDVQEGDILEVFKLEKKIRTL